MRTFRPLAVFLMLILVAANVKAEEVMVNNKDAKIRNGPGTNYTVLWKPRLYTPLEVLAKHADWYAVRDVEGDVGWLHDSVAAKGTAAIVTANMADVHASASGDSQVRYQAPKNYTFKVEESKGGWLKVVDPDGDDGWIAQKAVWTGTFSGEPKAKEAKEEKKEKKKESKKEPKKAKKK